MQTTDAKYVTINGTFETRLAHFMKDHPDFHGDQGDMYTCIKMVAVMIGKIQCHEAHRLVTDLQNNWKALNGYWIPDTRKIGGLPEDAITARGFDALVAAHNGDVNEAAYTCYKAGKALKFEELASKYN